MRLTNDDDKTITEIRVVNKTEKSVFVLFPALEIPVQMTIKYFDHLKNTGMYAIFYDINMQKGGSGNADFIVKRYSKFTGVPFLLNHYKSCICTLSPFL